jgi:hypothetical protein
LREASLRGHGTGVAAATSMAIGAAPAAIAAIGDAREALCAKAAAAPRLARAAHLVYLLSLAACVVALVFLVAKPLASAVGGSSLPSIEQSAPQHPRLPFHRDLMPPRIPKILV